MNGLQHLFLRLAFFAAFLLLAIAALEYLVNFLGFTILRSLYTPGRLLEIASVMILFVVALLLRQIRDGMQRGKA
jgi:hypothetical protein